MTDLIREQALPGRTVMVVEHKVQMISALCGRVICLNGGEIIADGPPDVVLSARAVIDAYLGEDPDA